MAKHPWDDSYPKDVDWKAEIAERPLYDILDAAVADFPDNRCLDFLGKTYTYAEIGGLVDRAAKGFQDRGVGPGERVGLFLPNSPHYVICYFGVLKAGGTIVNFNPLYAPRELLHQIEDSQTDTMVTLNLTALYPKMATMLAQSRVKTLIIGNMPEILPFPKSLLFPLVKRKDIAKVPQDSHHIAYRDLLANDGKYAPVDIAPREAVAVLQYTGGTTGVSKGAMLTHANLYANTVQAEMWFAGLERGKERTLGVLPFFHVFAMTCVLNMSIRIGAEIVVHPRFEIDAVLKDIDGKKPTLFHGVPTMYTAINAHKDLQKYDLSSLKAGISGGAPLPVEVKQNFEQLTGCKLVEGYGLTESSPIAGCNPLHGVNKPGSIGMPVPGTTFDVTDMEDPNKVLPQGEKGEICITGPQVMAGYWNRPDDTAKTIIDGRLHTGDIGYIDEDGYTFLIDRQKDLIISGGYNVYPRNVEEAIYLHPEVEEVTVIAIPDDYRGQVPKAFVKLREGGNLADQELMAFLGDKLAKFELPHEIEFRAELPKTLIGKLSKKELVAEEEAKRAAKSATS